MGFFRGFIIKRAYEALTLLLPLLVSSVLLLPLFIEHSLSSSFSILLKRVNTDNVSTTELPSLYILEVIPTGGHLPLVIFEREKDKFVLVPLCTNSRASRFAC